MTVQTSQKEKTSSNRLLSTIGILISPVSALLGFGLILYAVELTNWFWTIVLTGFAIGLVIAIKRFSRKPIGKVATTNLTGLMLFLVMTVTVPALNPTGYQKYMAEQEQQSTLETSTEQAVAEPTVSEEQATHTLTPKEAKTIAYDTLKKLERIEDDIALAIRQRDRTGYGAYGVKPITEIMNNWPNSQVKGNEAIEPYNVCRAAAGELWNLGDNFKQPPSVERQHEIEADEASYNQQIALCKQAIQEH